MRLASPGTDAALSGMWHPSPRVLLVMPEQWPRALLRAALREAGYDALGAPGLAGALRYRADAPDRGPVRVILVDQRALTGDDAGAKLSGLARRHGDPALLLLARGGPGPDTSPEGGWHRIIRRPASIAELVEAVRVLIPLPPGAARPLD
jgi:DNA-binding response OmpR family regulator